MTLRQNPGYVCFNGSPYNNKSKEETSSYYQTAEQLHKMPPKRHNTTSKRIKWTEEMVADLLLCRERALAEQINQDNRRKGDMEIMRLLWEEKRYAPFGLTAQNLRDRAAQAIKDPERNRHRDMDVQNANDECSDVTERPVDEFRHGSQEGNTGFLGKFA